MALTTFIIPDESELICRADMAEQTARIQKGSLVLLQWALAHPSGVSVGSTPVNPCLEAARLKLIADTLESFQSQLKASSLT